MEDESKKGLTNIEIELSLIWDKSKECSVLTS